MPRRKNQQRVAQSDAREMEIKVKAFRQWIAASREAAELQDFFDERLSKARWVAESRNEKDDVFC